MWGQFSDTKFTEKGSWRKSTGLDEKNRTNLPLPQTNSEVYTWRIDDLKDCPFGMFTRPKFNIAPENRPSQKETGVPTIHF